MVLCGQLTFNYHIANDTWPDAHYGIAELEKYPEASNWDWMRVNVLRYARRRMRIVCFHVEESFKESFPLCDGLTSRRGAFWHHVSPVDPPAIRHIHVKNQILFMWDLMFPQHWHWWFWSSGTLCSAVGNLTYPNVSKECTTFRSKKIPHTYPSNTFQCSLAYDISNTEPLIWCLFSHSAGHLNHFHMSSRCYKAFSSSQ